VKRCLVAVDQSTSATKALLFSEAGAITHRVSLEHKQHYPGPGMIEHDPEEIYENTLAAAARVMKEAGIEPEAVVALALTNQRETVMVWDGETGRPLHNALVWQDQRGTPACEALREKGQAALVREKTGLLLDTYFSASKLKWLVDEVPEVREAARKGRALWGTVDSWLVWKLTGGEVHATDFSNACRTMLFNVYDLAWDEDLKELFSAGDLRFPQVCFADDRFGRVQLPGTEVEVPITGVLGDSHAALFGECGFRPGDAKATYGTGSSVMMNVGPEPIEPPEGIVLSLAFGQGGRVDYAFEGNIHCSGDTLKWLHDGVCLFDDYREMESTAASLPDNGGVYLVPAFAGLGAPYWEHGVRAIITGLERSSTRAHILRAAEESIAYQVNDLISEMRRDPRIPVADLRVDGGATRDAFLMQFQADILGMPIRVADIEDVSARGAAFVAGLAVGLWPDRETLEGLWQERARYEPQMGAEERAVLIEGWRSAVRQVLARRS
jgi:glycerol kinase